MTIDERFWKYVEKTDTCWIWRGARLPDGYGRFKGGRSTLAHRVAYELVVGPIPDGLTIDHLCRVRHCVNPSHLEPVTRGENVLRGESPFAKNARKTHCVRGHELTGANLLRNRPGDHHRRCRLCKCASNLRDYYARKAVA